ncbi:hypothetical protein N0V82_003615 [Gnomoniopsis sp. IMI 355080]|nr:hypothetical protein N0V82_003615 [Gnomoniopsis sp. IMI 355080]
MAQKRTIDAFFPSPAKQRRVNEREQSTVTRDDSSNFSTHATYPFPIPGLPSHISKDLSSLPAVTGRIINDQPDLDLIYFEPYIPTYLAKDLFTFLRADLPFYRVKYSIKRFGVETAINTPRYTTVFGLDETSRFSASEDNTIVDAKTGTKVPASAYARYVPRPIPRCLDDLRRSTEAATGCSFNFCLVNYYSSGSDSISYHSDDERFLGDEPAIASFSLGARRDFLMKHKPTSADKQQAEAKPLKLPLGSGDMILMKGKTQRNWLHSIPKRSGKNEVGGRINITFRRAMVKGGTDNYYNYNVGAGPVYRWNEGAREMQIWKS